MKTLILANYDVGLYQFRYELIEELLKDGEVYISLPYGELIEPFEELGCVFLDTPVDRRGLNPIKDSFLFLRYLVILKRIKPDQVITYTVKPNVYGGLACRLLHTSYAVNITGLGTAFEQGGLLKKLVTLLYKAACKKAKVVFFENSENRKLFVDEKIVKEGQTYLLAGAGVNTERYQVTEYPRGDAIKFLFVGRVMKEKGMDELFSAMKLLVADGYNCSLDVVGGYEENYGETIKKYEAEGWLKYHGYQKDVRPFYAACHCFVLPSWHEGMANTNLEAAASGRPVITSNIHGCLEAVEEGVSGFLCERKNAEDLYQAMKRFLSLTYGQRAAMGLAGRRRMESLFDKKTVVKQTLMRLNF